MSAALLVVEGSTPAQPGGGTVAGPRAMPQYVATRCQRSVTRVRRTPTWDGRQHVNDVLEECAQLLREAIDARKR